MVRAYGGKPWPGHFRGNFHQLAGAQFLFHHKPGQKGHPAVGEQHPHNDVGVAGLVDGDVDVRVPPSGPVAAMTGIVFTRAVVMHVRFVMARP